MRDKLPPAVLSGPVRLLGLNGSLGAGSVNAALLGIAAGVTPAGVALVIHGSLGEVPFFDAGLDPVPDGVADLRGAVEAADGLVIATPEYGHSMPGVLKNALDWLVGSGELANMPVAIMSASTTPGGGIRAQMALTQHLLAQAADVVAWLTVPAARKKVDRNGEIIDPAVRRRVAETLAALVETVGAYRRA